MAFCAFFFRLMQFCDIHYLLCLQQFCASHLSVFTFSSFTLNRNEFSFSCHFNTYTVTSQSLLIPIMPVISAFLYILPFFFLPPQSTLFQRNKGVNRKCKTAGLLWGKGKRCPVPQENMLIPTDFNHVQCIKYNPMPVFYRSAVHNRQ